ncbi:perforin-1-like [Hyperolius riggenbachi]|uniref:perforin-1-like n=1 Tax=Hyperolius riggenbachi TaxID=752182 RepID=UPI0035A280A9
MLPLILFPFFLPLALSTITPPILTSGCRLGTKAECEKAMFVPGHTLLGEGVNIVTMKTTGSFLIDMQHVKRNCTLCNNPFSNNVMQKLPRAMVDWRPQTSCSRNIASSTSHSKVSMANEASSEVTNDWKTSLDVNVPTQGGGSVSVGGSHSDLAKFADSKTVTDKYTFYSQKMHCTQYSFGTSINPPLTTHFNQAVKQLPASYNSDTKSVFKNFISLYGTHYITKAEAGGRIKEVTAVKTCQVALSGMKMDDVKNCLNAEASITADKGAASATLSSEVAHCKQKAEQASRGHSFHHMYNERWFEVKGGKATFQLLSGEQDSAAFQKWMESLKTEPGLVSYALEPIHNLVKPSQQQNLRKAVSDYIKEMALTMKCPCSSQPSANGDCSCGCTSSKYTNSDCCPTRKGEATLEVTIKYANNLYGDFTSQTDAYVKVVFDVAQQQTQIIDNNNNPKWNKLLGFGTVELDSFKKIKVEVWDKDMRYDDLLGMCQEKVTSGSVDKTCKLNYGTLYYSINVKCSSYLMGEYCRDYSPVPPK